jgi:hypothetical protein
MNSCLVKFEDGFTMVTSRNALKCYVTAELRRVRSRPPCSARLSE